MNQDEARANQRDGEGEPGDGRLRGDGMDLADALADQIRQTRDRALAPKHARGAQEGSPRESNITPDEEFDISLEDAHTLFEELRVAEEELRQQNENLIAAQEVAELERQRYRDLFEF